MVKREVRHYPNLETLSRMAAEYICTLAEACVRERGVVTVVLSGGNTPKTLYEQLAQPPFDTRMPWQKIHLFWGDERCVPPDHPDSNLGMVLGVLISKVPIPPENVHPISAGTGSPEEAARVYERILQEFPFSPVKNDAPQYSSSGGRRFPAFDLIMLGVGKDGHTASLFPEDEVLEEKKSWVAAVTKPRGSPPVPRITLTLPVINRARCVLFLVSGAEKRDVVRLIMKDPETAGRLYPAARVRPEGRVVWFLDEEAV